MVRINSSIGYDKKLFDEDIEASKAHATMLCNQKIISEIELKKLILTLDIIRKELKQNKIKFDDKLEDIHTHIEARLIQLIGPLGKKLHTARSRNDQVITDVKLWLRKQNKLIDNLLKNLQLSLLKKAENNIYSYMPGFTHLQVAQPITLAHHFLAYVNMFGRDRENNKHLIERHNYSPLGSAALAGTTFNINRDETASKLGFKGPMTNSIDAVSDRDFLLDTLNLCCSIAIHLSRLAEEIVLWSSPGFDFIILPDTYSTGSSIMPQKKNPDAAELIRGKSGRVLGNYVSLFNIMKALPLAYSKDMQEDKEPLFDSIQTTKDTLNVMAEMINEISFKTDNMLKMCNKGHITATDFADALVSELKIPFRDAHRLTGKIVALADKKNVQIHELKIKDYKKIDVRIKANIINKISIENAVKNRVSLGGTSPANIKKEIIFAKEKWLND
jgi:argininosuccinate lyase